MTNEFANISYILEREEGKKTTKKTLHFSLIDTISNVVVLKLLGLTF